MAAVAAIIGITLFIGASVDQALTDRLDYALNLRWEENDAERYEKIIDYLDRVDGKLDYLMGYEDASRLPGD